MARSRIIKPAFFTDDELVELPFETRLLFIGLWTLADRRGRLEYRPKRIKMSIFPADDVPIEQMLKDLHIARKIILYEVDGLGCIAIPGFERHQKIHPKELESTINPPRLAGSSREKVHLEITLGDIDSHLGDTQPDLGVTQVSPRCDPGITLGDTQPDLGATQVSPRCDPNSLTSCSTSCSTSTSTSTSVSVSPRGGAAADTDLSGLAKSIWANHPKHRRPPVQAVERALAQLAMESPDPTSTAERISDNHTGWVASEEWTKDGGRFVPNLLKWLDPRPEVGGWMTEPPEAAQSPPQGKKRGAVIDMQAVMRNLEEWQNDVAR